MQSIPTVRGGGDPIPKGEVFEVLQNERRRFVIQYLRRNGGPVDLGELATQVAAWEYDSPCDGVTKQQRKRVYTTLQQTHLPKMAEAGIVEYDPDAGRIDRTSHTDELTVYLEIVPGSEFPWREYYLSLGAVTLTVMVILWVGVYPFTLMDPLAWGALFATVLTASAAYHTFAGHEIPLSEYESSDDDER